MARSATCGPRPATATRARSPTPSTPARPTTAAASTATPAWSTTRYALLVDGGTYNGVDVTGHRPRQGGHDLLAGPDAYQTPTTDFADHADGLEASCTDLVGAADQQAEHRRRTPGPTRPHAITAADCAQVTNAIAAVRAAHGPDAVQLPAAAQAGRSRACCGAGHQHLDRRARRTSRTAWPAGTKDAADRLPRRRQQPVGGRLDSAGRTRPAGWLAVSTTRRGSAAPRRAGDFSSRDSITSPGDHDAELDVNTPKLSLRPLRGHRVRLRRRQRQDQRQRRRVHADPAVGVRLQPVQLHALRQHQPARRPGRASPAPTAARSPARGAPRSSTWPASASRPATQLRLRFDMGRDGCGGIDGWYVDNVKVTNCERRDAAPPAMLASTTSAKPDPKKIEPGKPFKVKVDVAATGATPAGWWRSTRAPSCSPPGRSCERQGDHQGLQEEGQEAQAGQEHPDREVPRLDDLPRQPGRLRGQGRRRRTTESLLS